MDTSKASSTRASSIRASSKISSKATNVADPPAKLAKIPSAPATLSTLRANGQDSMASNKGLEESLAAKATALNPSHFGLRHLIRTWVAIAMKRRSFSLLAKASTLAAKTGVTMDNIFCGEGSHVQLSMLSGFEAYSSSLSPMSFLIQDLLTPLSAQDVDNRRLLWHELPTDLLAATACQVPMSRLEATNLPNVTDQAPLAPALGSRWIFVRLITHGRSRYFCSPNFERDIVSWATIQWTWNSNQREVTSLFLPKSELESHAHTLMHQFSIHELPNMPGRANRYKTRIKVKPGVVPASSPNLLKDTDGELSIAVDAVMCLKLIDEDTAFLFMEYAPDDANPAGLASSQSAEAMAQPHQASRIGPLENVGTDDMSIIVAKEFLPSDLPSSNAPEPDRTGGCSQLPPSLLLDASSERSGGSGGRGGVLGFDFIDLDGGNPSLTEMSELLDLIRQCP